MTKKSDPKTEAPTKGSVTARKCECCGHHEIGITTPAGEFFQLKPGTEVLIAERGPAGDISETARRPDSVSRPQWAKKRFLTHWHCTQAIFETYCRDYGLAPDLAVKISAPFAVGMARGMLCGAVAGAYLVLGLAKGKSHTEDPQANNAVFTDVNALISALENRFGPLSCNTLMGTDMATPEGIQKAGSQGLFKTKCLLLVEQVALELEKLLGTE